MAWLRFFMFALTAFMTFSVATPAMAQQNPNPPGGSQEESPGFFDRFGDYLTIENNAESFDRRRQDAKDLIESYPCVACDVFNAFATAVFDGMSRVDGEGRNFIPVLVGLANVFALFYLFSAFVSGDASDIVGRWQVFWRLCLAVAFASMVLLQPVTFIWNNVYDLIFSIGAGVVDFVGGNSVQCSKSLPALGASAPAGAQYALGVMQTTVCGAYEMTLDGIANGFAMATQKDGLVNSLIYAVAGLFVIAIYGYLALTFPLRFIDIVIRLAIVSILTPILVVCAVFKPTRGYAMIGVTNVLNATAQFAVLSIIFKIGSQVFDTMTDITIQAPVQTETGGFGLGAIGLGSIGGDQDVTGVLMQALVLVGIALVFNALVKSVPAIAAEISRSSGGGMDAGGNAAVGMVGRATSTGAKGSGTATKFGAGAVGAGARKVMGRGVT